MAYWEAVRVALESLRAHKLRSFFTVVGTVVAVGFLVAVLAIIAGLNRYVRTDVADAMIGTHTFQVRRTPIYVQPLLDNIELQRMAQRPLIQPEEAEAVRAAVPNALAVAYQSAWPPPFGSVRWRGRELQDVIVFGATHEYGIIYGHEYIQGRGLSALDASQTRPVAVLGWDIADRLFEGEADPIGREIRVDGHRFIVIGVNRRRGAVLGTSRDYFVLIPITVFEKIYGRRRTTVISVRMADTRSMEEGMARAEEAMRRIRRLRPGQENDFAVETSGPLLDFWQKITEYLFYIVPAVVGIGVLVGGIVIMNIQLVSVNERTREIGLRKALGAQRRDILRQFLVESVTISTVGGALGIFAGTALALLVRWTTPLPARVSPVAVLGALALGACVGLFFGLVPAARAARLDPIEALRHE